MGKCECGRLKGNPCGPLRPNTINVTMPPASLHACGVDFPFATATSICRKIVTICSGLYLCIGILYTRSQR